MLLFESTLASAGGALILTVTCDSAFAGQTITCTDGTTTLTQTCPSASPYTVEFKIPNSGTWTVSSGTDSVNVTIPDTATLHHIPTGSTVTPTNDIQTWLNCANIWDKSYTTISEVLNDATTVTALIASNNAADYMARSTTWASDVCADSSAMTKIGANDYCADTLLSDSTWRTAICNSTYFESVLNVKIPTMTSNTTPSGNVIEDGTFRTGNEGYKAFDGNNETYAFGILSTSTFFLEYQFGTALKAYRLDYKLGSPTQSAGQYDVSFQYHNGTNWMDAYTDLTVPSTGTQSGSRIMSLPSATRFRLYGTRKSTYTPTMYTIQLYGRA